MGKVKKYWCKARDVSEKQIRFNEQGEMACIMMQTTGKLHSLYLFLSEDNVGYTNVRKAVSAFLLGGAPKFCINNVAPIMWLQAIVQQQHNSPPYSYHALGARSWSFSPLRRLKHGGKPKSKSVFWSHGDNNSLAMIPR